MKLPSVQLVRVPERKIVDYLLSPTHWEGHSKAVFFTRLGFSRDEWKTLADALVRHAVENEVTQSEETPFGTRYVIEGIISTPSGRSISLRSVWFVEAEGTAPRFVTAYPAPGRRK